MIHITNSIFKSFTDCPAKTMAMYEGRITGKDIAPSCAQDGSRDMACGSLVDAIVTCGYRPDAGDKTVTEADFYAYLKSSYDDGRKNASWLVNKKGGWNAYAKTAINSAYRVLADSTVQDILARSEMQVRISFNLDAETVWEGDIDILEMEDRTLRIIDLKAPGQMKEGWIIVNGQNQKVSWQDSWSYWFQLSGYRYAFQNAHNSTLVNGVPLSDTKYAHPFCIDTGLLVTTREAVPMVKYIPIPDYGDWWRAIIKGRMSDDSMSNLEAIKRIVKGEIEAPKCGDCEFCRPTNKVVIEESTSFEGDVPASDDMFRYAEIDDENIYADEY